MKGWQKMVLAVFAILGLLGGVVFLAMNYLPGTLADDPSQGPQTSPSQPDSIVGPWENRSVKKTVSLQDLNNNDVTSATLHVFADRPTDSEGEIVWGNERAIEAYYGTNQEKDQVSVSSADTTIQYTPGTYYVAVESSGKYTTFTKVTIPDGSSYSGTTLNEYNQAPETRTITVADKYSPTLSSFDVSVGSNTTSIEEWSADQTIKPSEDTRYEVWKMVVHTGTNDPTTDSDSDGNHDEGIRKIYVDISGAGLASERSDTIFYPSNGIDKLGSDDKATINLDDLTATSGQPLTVTANIVTFETSTAGASDGDEVFTDGENPIDIQLFDQSGTGTSKASVTG